MAGTFQWHLTGDRRRKMCFLRACFTLAGNFYYSGTAPLIINGRWEAFLKLKASEGKLTVPAPQLKTLLPTGSHHSRSHECGWRNSGIGRTEWVSDSAESQKTVWRWVRKTFSPLLPLPLTDLSFVCFFKTKDSIEAQEEWAQQYLWVAGQARSSQFSWCLEQRNNI